MSHRVPIFAALLLLIPSAACAQQADAFTGEVTGAAARAWNGRAAFCTADGEMQLVLADLPRGDVIRFLRRTDAPPAPGTYAVHDIGDLDPDRPELWLAVPELAGGGPGLTYEIDSGSIQVSAAETDVLRGTFTLRLRETSAAVEFTEGGAAPAAEAVARGSFTAARESCDAVGT